MAKYMQDSTDIQINEVSGTDNINFSFKSGNSIDTKIGNLTDLETTDKSSVVNAINSVVESGSNANGSYVKFADGTMICTKKEIISTAINSQWGALYESSDVILGQFPQTFISTPKVSVTNNSSSGSGALIEAVFGVTTTSAGKCWLCRGTSRASASYELDIIAIGRWK